MSQPALAYRADIDGLRAIAIAGVLAFHLNENSLTGGFVGVDVFFVISGFLISSIINRDLCAGQFSIIRFYERRIRRIFPALLVVIAAVLAVGILQLLPLDLMALGKSVRYAILGFSNVHFLHETEDYFNESVSQIPLLHTWSLGVEEQFYLLFPFLLAVSYRYLKSPRLRLLPVALVFVFSLAASAWVVQTHPMKGFFLLPFRAWEMMLGALLALVPLPSPGRRLNQGIGLAGMGMIIGSMWFFGKSTVFPGLSALVPCGGAAMVIFAGRQPSCWVARLLSLKPVVFLGLISYSVYLWHWPLIAFAKYSMPYDGKVMAVIAAASLLLGYLSWRFVERPFRHQGRGSRKMVFSAWGAATLVFIGGCLLISRNDGFPDRFPWKVTYLLSFKEKPAIWKQSGRSEDEAVDGTHLGTPNVPAKYVLWGDSHGSALLPMMDALAKENGQAFECFGLGAVPPVVDVLAESDEDAEDRSVYSRKVLDILVADHSISTVIIHARWSLYCRGRNELGESEPKAFYGQPYSKKEDLDRYYAERIKETVDSLLASGKKVVLVYPVPEARINIPDFLAKQVLDGEKEASTIDCTDYFQRQRFVIKTLDALGDDPQITRIRPAERLLNGNKLTISADGKPLYMDDDHLSLAGALYLKPLFQNIFRSQKDG